MTAGEIDICSNCDCNEICKCQPFDEDCNNYRLVLKTNGLVDNWEKDNHCALYRNRLSYREAQL